MNRKGQSDIFAGAPNGLDERRSTPSPLEGHHSTDYSQSPISTKGVVLLSISLILLCVVFIISFSHYPFYSCCFSQLSAAIRHWDFKDLDPSQPKELWGYPYLSALVAAITRLPDDYAIVLVSSVMFVLANYLCSRLWGAGVAVWFTVVNWAWLDSGAEGLTEPLFMALLCGSFLAVRKQRWALSAFLASGATIVRPVGIFALVAIGLVLLSRQEMRRLIVAGVIALAVGAIYIVPMVLVYGDPFANARGYRSQDWSSSLPFTIPLWSLVQGFYAVIVKLRPEHGLRLAEMAGLESVTAAWVLSALAATIKMLSDTPVWSVWRKYPAEGIFGCAYAVFLFSYNSPKWAWEMFPRFVIPLVPFLLLTLVDRLPKDKRILWSVALLNIAVSVLPKTAVHVMPPH